MKIWEDLLQDIEKNIPSDTECELKMMHSKSALTRFANSQIHQNVDEESADVFLTLHNDSKTVTMCLRKACACACIAGFAESLIDMILSAQRSAISSGVKPRF